MPELILGTDWHLWSPDEQLAWAEQLSTDDLWEWLRKFVWARATDPIVAPPTTLPLTHLSHLLRRGSPPLFTRVRTVVPGLLQEWGRDDPKGPLEDLLFLCGTLRCAAAEATIALITTDRLEGRPDETGLRQNCLSVLSGLGCTERTAPLFRRYISDVNYSALCYRALYRYDLSNAARELPRLVQTHLTAEVTQQLRPVLNILFFTYLSCDQRAEVWGDVLRTTRPKVLEIILRVFQSLDIVLAVPFKTSGPQEVEVIYGYSSDNPLKGGDKIDTADIDDETVIVITHTLERYLLASNRVGSAIMSDAAIG